MTDFKDKLSTINLGMKHKDSTKTVRDELGNDTTEHWDGRQDVHIRAPKVELVTQPRETR